jgi:CBS domain-containing protein
VIILSENIRDYINMAILVKDVMTRQVMTTAPETTVREAAKTIADNHIGSLVVVKGHKVIGIITERDMLLCFAATKPENIGKKLVRDAMTNYIYSITPKSSIQSAIHLMRENRVKKLPVIDNNDRLVGIITASDIVTAQPKLIKDVKALIVKK